MVRNLTCLSIVSEASTALWDFPAMTECSTPWLFSILYIHAIQYGSHLSYDDWEPKFKFPCVTSGCLADHIETSYMENRLRGAAGDLVQLVETPGFYPQYNIN